MLYVVGGGEENEILLFSVVLALRDSLALLLKLVFLLPLLFSFFFQSNGYLPLSPPHFPSPKQLPARLVQNLHLSNLNPSLRSPKTPETQPINAP